MPSPADAVPADRNADGRTPGFAAALLDPDRRVPDGISGPEGKRANRRFSVYRNNVTVGLIDALGEIFPAVKRLVGSDFFRDMAREYVRRDPPRSRLVFEYGAGFAEFLETFEPVRRLAYLPDTARLERAWLDAYHAADAAPLAGDALSAIAPDRLPLARFGVHPAMRIVRSRYAIVSIFVANRSDEEPGRIDAGVPEDALVTRPGLDVEIRRLPSGCATFIERLSMGETLAGAVERAVADTAGFDVAQAIGIMIDAGVFHEISADPAG